MKGEALCPHMRVVDPKMSLDPWSPFADTEAMSLNIYGWLHQWLNTIGILSKHKP